MYGDDSVADAYGFLDDPVHWWGWGMAGGVPGQALLLLVDPVPGLFEVLELDSLEEVEQVQPRYFFGHMFECTTVPQTERSPRP